MTATLPPLILASGSRYRAAMLERLGIPFTVQTSGIDETPRPNESTDDLVRRLALDKASQIADTAPGALVIGADQVAVLEDRNIGERILGKPGNHRHAVEQLNAMSGQTIRFLSGFSLLGPGIRRVDVVPTTMRMRRLTNDEIERYVERDQPFDCAGAMRSESLGICLLDSLTSDDPTALIGLPLIRLAQWLREAGFALP
ncbi:MAG: nucleoside triphosphate pyrophosphatase [Wenzhouxiangellaceae bacterium]|nr:nucleoside triphosphate pyrophosphatase [Wenzhouxiangellaceae bacterium]